MSRSKSCLGYVDRARALSLRICHFVSPVFVDGPYGLFEAALPWTIPSLLLVLTSLAHLHERINRKILLSYMVDTPCGVSAPRFRPGKQGSQHIMSQRRNRFDRLVGETSQKHFMGEGMREAARGGLLKEFLVQQTLSQLEVGVGESAVYSIGGR